MVSKRPIIFAADVIIAFTLKTATVSLCSVLPTVVGVAVAKRSSRNIFIGNLGGRRSCHGHMYSPAGWLLPYRHTLSLEHNSSSPCDPNQGTVLYGLLHKKLYWITSVLCVLLTSHDTFYCRLLVLLNSILNLIHCCTKPHAQYSCSLPLCVFSVYNDVFWKGCLPGTQGNLCKVCMGGTGEAATKRCADNHNERYYGNMGALRYA